MSSAISLFMGGDSLTHLGPLPSKCLASWAHVLIEDAREARVRKRSILLGCWDVWEGVRENADGGRDQGAGASLVFVGCLDVGRLGNGKTRTVGEGAGARF